MIFHPIKSPGDRKKQSSKQGGQGGEGNAGQGGEGSERAPKAPGERPGMNKKRDIPPA